MAAVPSVPEHMLPDPTFTVRQLLMFKLPPVEDESREPYPCMRPYHGQPPLFLDTEPDCTDPAVIATIMPPRKAFVDILMDKLPDAVKSGAKAVDTDLPTHMRSTFPLWVIPYWKGVFVAVEAKQPWILAEAFLVRQSKGDWDDRPGRMPAADLMRTALQLLYETVASGPINGFSESEPITRLSTFASHDWLATPHISLMLDLLKLELARAGRHDILIPSTDFYTCIRNAWKCREDYAETISHSTARRWGMRMSLQNLDIASLANVDDNHWISFAICPRLAKINYGDSMSKEVHGEFREVISWWTEFHCERKFRWATMKIVKQLDMFSCGILGGNGLGHHYMGKDFPLALSGLRGADIERVEILWKVLLRHHVCLQFPTC